MLAHEHLHMNFDCSFHQSKHCSVDSNKKLVEMSQPECAMVRQFPYHFYDNLNLTDYEAGVYWFFRSLLEKVLWCCFFMKIHSDKEKYLGLFLTDHPWQNPCFKYFSLKSFQSKIEYIEYVIKIFAFIECWDTKLLVLKIDLEIRRWSEFKRSSRFISYKL